MRVRVSTSKVTGMVTGTGIGMDADIDMGRGGVQERLGL